jgi:hypothetical protein
LAHDRHGRVVGVKDLALTHPIAQELARRLDHPGRRRHPATQGAAGDIHLLTRKYLLDPIQRQMIGEFAGDHTRQQARAGQAPLDPFGRPLGQADVGVAIARVAFSTIAMLAGVFVADVLKHQETGREVFQLLGTFPADAMPLFSAAGTGLLLF